MLFWLALQWHLLASTRSFSVRPVTDEHSIEVRPEPALELTSRIPAWANGKDLLVYLVSRFPYLTAESWRAELAAGRVSIAGKRVATTLLVRRGQVLCWLRQASEPEVDRDYRVVLHHDEFIVVDKPAHLPCHADGAFVRNTLVHLLGQKLGKVHLVHRLDRETSGLLVVARTERARSALDQQFRSGTIQKSYLAVVHGLVDADFIAEGFLGHDLKSAIAVRRSVVAATAPGAKAARTEVVVIQRGSDRTLVRITPRTGRTHQIRVHLAAHGHPILGDKLYGRSDDQYLDFVRHVKAGGTARFAPDGGPNRQLLHASRLVFNHPIDKVTVDCESAVSIYMQSYCPAPL